MRFEYVSEKAEGQSQTSCDAVLALLYEDKKVRDNYCKERLAARRRLGYRLDAS